MSVLEECSWNESGTLKDNINKCPFLRNVCGMSEERQKESSKKFIPEEWLVIPEERPIVPEE